MVEPWAEDGVELDEPEDEARPAQWMTKEPPPDALDLAALPLCRLLPAEPAAAREQAYRWSDSAGKVWTARLVSDEGPLPHGEDLDVLVAALRLLAMEGDPNGYNRRASAWRLAALLGKQGDISRALMIEGLGWWEPETAVTGEITATVERFRKMTLEIHDSESLTKRRLISSVTHVFWADELPRLTQISVPSHMVWQAVHGWVSCLDWQCYLGLPTPLARRLYHVAAHLALSENGSASLIQDDRLRATCGVAEAFPAPEWRRHLTEAFRVLLEAEVLAAVGTIGRGDNVSHKMTPGRRLEISPEGVRSSAHDRKQIDLVQHAFT